MKQTKQWIEFFKKFSETFPEYYRIKNPNFWIMTKYYIRKPTFKYLWFLFYKQPLRIIFNFLFSLLPFIIKEFFKKQNKEHFHSSINKRDLIDNLSRGNGFITISYCQKPLNCPDSRFSLKCTAKHLECKECFLSQIKRKADILGIDYYIVLGDYDSVWNILKTQFLKRKKGVYIITICNMVMNVIKYLSLLFGLKGYILPFVKGECKTLAAYELSEFGYKNIQTDISLQNKSILLEILNESIKRKMLLESVNKTKKGVFYEKAIQSGN